jgi:hypothetical protein
MFAVLIAAVCMLALLPCAGALSIQLDPLMTTAGASGSASVASVNDNYPISVEQAKNSVRVFMNDLTLEPTLDSTGSLENGNYYLLSVGPDTFNVNQNTGVVEFVHFGSNAPDSANLTITRDEAYAKATAYAGQKYEGFSAKSWKLVVDKVYSDYSYLCGEHSCERVDIKAYDFVLREEKDHVLLPNIVHVRVNPVTGAIVDYWGINRLVTVGLKNTVSLSEATETAEQYLGIGSGSSFKLSSSEAYLAVVTRYQNVENLAWVVKLKGYYSWDSEERTYYAVVDANDGSVLGNNWDNIWPEHKLAYYLN